MIVPLTLGLLGFEAQPNNFFSNIPTDIQEIIESNTSITSLPVALMADPIDLSNLSGEFKTLSSSQIGTRKQDSIGEYGLAEQNIDTTVPTTSKPEIKVFGTSQIGESKIGIGQNCSQIGSSKLGAGQISTKETSISQISSIQTGIEQNSTSQIRSGEIGISKSSVTQNSTNQTGIGKIGSNEMFGTQIESHQIGIAEIFLPVSNQIINLFGSQSWGVNSQNFGSIDTHISDSSQLLSTFQSTLATYWNIPADLNLTFNITNLPTGQLAEATINGYDQLGRPNTATISIDDDANGVGWFVDSTPGDSSEFQGVGVLGSGGVGEYFQASSNSAAYGKYDLLTTILHEMGHTLGIINGYSEFNKYVKGRQFITDTFTANLTPDGSHLDTTFHPYDLMNTSLRTGVRKLPSALNLAMIDAINSGVGGWVSGVGKVNPAHLTAGALIGINNGDFTTTADWNTLGASNIINGTATLTEQSQKLAELTQAFIIPTGAKMLQFTIKDNHLVRELGSTGVGGNKAPDDAFEVALLDTNTFNPLAGTSIGLNHTDSLLNIQANGTIHKSDKVTITALTNNSSIVTIDLTQITPTTQATLYFNLLGFGARTSTVTIDDVKLFTDTQPIPVTKNDTLTTTQNTPLTLTTIQLTTNDTNITQIQIINQPQHGTLTLNPPLPLPGGDFTYTYTPDPTYVGTDSFTYLGFGSDGQISNLATVNLTVNNLPPTIETILIPNQINEGQTIQLQATAKDGGSIDNLTYIWDLGDSSQPVIGQNITYQFTDNGTYKVNLTVTDKDGGITQQSTQIVVDNVAPTATITNPNTTLNQGETLNLGVNYSDAGIKDTHTITWNFVDDTAPVTLGYRVYTSLEKSEIGVNPPKSPLKRGTKTGS